jgi:2-methylcitrate dehydratase PrpD
MPSARPSATPSATEQVATFISSFAAASAPDEAYHIAKLAIRDTLGVALAAWDEPACKVLRTYVDAAPGARQASIWGAARRVGALEAALLNGAAAHALDYDDLNRSIGGHPTAVIAPSVFAAGQVVRCTGQQALDAYVLGFEVMAKLGQALNPGLYLKGWHPTSVLGVMGACAASCYLLGLGHEQVVNALGVAASEASGIKKNFGSMTKPLHAGSAARKGLWAAQLARAGLTADRESLDGAFGYLELFQGDAPFDPGPLAHLGEPFDIVASGLAFKQYPCCGSTHPVVDCILDIKHEHGVDAAQVISVDCRVHPQRVGHIDRAVVATPLQAKFSLQCVTAMALADGFIGLGQFSSPAYLRPMVQGLMSRVNVVPDETLAEFGARVVVRMTDGRCWTGSAPEAKGSPSLPIPDADLERKFVDCASTLLDQPQAEEAARLIMALETQRSLEPLLHLLAATPEEDACC